jgi:beta-galactosidase
MKKLFLISICMLILINLTNAQTAREKTLFNFDWLYLKGTARTNNFQNALKSHFQRYVDETNWVEVQLPHDPAIEGDYDAKNSTASNGYRPFGNGWYRKHFTVDKSTKGKKVTIDFEGVYRDAELWINGVYLSRHLNGYLGFQIDLSKHLNYGGENVIAVKYDNSSKGTSRWYTGEGIYRDVYLIITDKVHVPQYGTYITTPKVSVETSLVKIETEVVNESADREMTKLVTEIIDGSGKKVAQSVSIVPINSGENFRFIQEIDVDTPKLWSCDEPNLYKSISKVYINDVLVDDYKTTFGIREIRMTPKKGLAVNGKKVIAKGGNMHHDLGPLGSAALRKGYERKLQRLKEMGCNSIRLSHNPHAPIFLDVADRMGFLVFNEAYDKWTSQYYGGVKSIEEMWQEDLTTFVKRDRNHPSVYIWSMGNEVKKQGGRHDQKFETPVAAADYGVGLFKRMVAHTKSLDPSRKVTVGLFPAREKFVNEWTHWDDYKYFTSSNPAEMAFYSDVVSWNYTENMFAPDHKRFPQLMFIASETSPNLMFGTRKNSWLELDKEKIIGHYLWTATDYLGEAGKWPKKVWGRAFLDITDEMTPIGYLYQQFYSEKPMVRIMVMEKEGVAKERFDNMKNKRWDWYPMTESWNWKEEKVTVQAMSNADEVELFLNGKSLGKKKYTDKYQDHLTWEVDYAAGELKAVARNNGKNVAEHILKTAGEPVAIKLDSDVESIKADGLDLAYIKVTLVDKDGIVVRNTDRLINFTVEGGGYNAGVANGDIFSNEHWNAEGKTSHKGKCLLVVRSNRKTEKITIKATADGLPGQTMVVIVN